MGFVIIRPVQNAGVAQLVEHDLAKVGVTGSSPATRSIVYVEKLKVKSSGPLGDKLLAFNFFVFSGRRSQVAKAEVCKTFIQRFKSARRLQFFRNH
jgi:hypothetical protein